MSEKGVIYITTTSIEGIIKIGKTETKNFNNRMRELERHGYCNMNGLHRYFAVEVENYSETEKLLHTIFAKSQIEETELFAINKDIVKSLLSKLKGTQIYPQPKITSFEPIETNTIKENDDIWFAASKRFNAKMKIEDGKYIVLQGSQVSKRVTQRVQNYYYIKNRKIKNGILLEDIITNTPSGAAIVVFGKDKNGWDSWKNSKGEILQKYRKELDSKNS